MDIAATDIYGVTQKITELNSEKGFQRATVKKNSLHSLYPYSITFLTRSLIL